MRHRLILNGADRIVEPQRLIGVDISVSWKKRYLQIHRMLILLQDA